MNWRGVFWPAVAVCLIGTGVALQALPSTQARVTAPTSSTVLQETPEPPLPEPRRSFSVEPTPSQAAAPKVSPRGEPVRVTASHNGQAKAYLDAPIDGGRTCQVRKSDGKCVLVPADHAVNYYNQPGYDAKPGEPGPSVLFGHIGSEDRPGVFRKLKSTVVGDTVKVTYESGDQAIILIDTVEHSKKLDLPKKKLWPSTDKRLVSLVTCDPDSKLVKGHYEDNYIAYGHVVEVIRAK